MSVIKADKVFIPVDKEPEFFEDWVLLRHGELDKNYTCTLEEQTNVIVLSGDELVELLIEYYHCDYLDKGLLDDTTLKFLKQKGLI